MKKLLFILIISIPLFAHSENKSNQYIFDLYKSKINLLELKTIILESYHLTKSWAFIEKLPVTQDKIRLKEITYNIFPKLVDSLSISKVVNNKVFNEKLSQCILLSKQLINEESIIMQKLQTYKDYQNVSILLEIESKFVDDGILSTLKNSLIVLLDDLIFEVGFLIDIEIIKCNQIEKTPPN